MWVELRTNATNAKMEGMAMDSVGSTGKRMEWIGNKRAQSGNLLISAASSLNYMLFVSCIVRPRKREL